MDLTSPILIAVAASTPKVETRTKPW